MASEARQHRSRIDQLRILVPLFALAAAVVAAVTDPASPSDLVLMAVPVGAFAIWAFVPRTSRVVVTIAVVVPVVAAQRTGSPPTIDVRNFGARVRDCVAALTPTELRLLVRDWTVLVFAFVFPPLVMLILAGVFGTHATAGFGWRNPQHYYVAASVGVPVLALALVGLAVTLASYRERGVLRRFVAFGVSPATVIGTQAIVAAGLILVGVGAVLVIAAPTCGISHVTQPIQTALGLTAGTLTLLLVGIDRLPTWGVYVDRPSRSRRRSDGQAIAGWLRSGFWRGLERLTRSSRA